MGQSLMPLLMGTWQLFVGGGPAVPLTISQPQSTQIVDVAAGSDLSARLVPGLTLENRFPMNGQGFWDESGQAISFGLTGQAAGATPVTYMFAGHQVVLPADGGDPAQDQLCTLVGEFQHVLAQLPPFHAVGFSYENARRQSFGWYAQITQIN
jgi:hypothetical protein